jgi:AraC family transcriptional regulator
VDEQPGTRQWCLGGRGYIKPWHWHDCLMLLLPSVGALDLRLEDRPEGSWISKDRFVVVPPNRAHRSRAMHDNHVHVAVYVTGPALREIERELGSLTPIRRKIKTSATFPMTSEIRVLQDLCRQGNRLSLQTSRPIFPLRARRFPLMRLASTSASNAVVPGK